jgi:putative cell wall-binding protein
MIGGPGSIGENVVDLLRCTGYDCERIAGDDRYETSALVAERVAASGETTAAFVVRGDTFPDALAVAPLAYRTHRPVLLVRPAALPSAIGTAVAEMKLKQVLAVGSANAVGDGVLAALRSKVTDVTRIASGRDRYETAALTARYAVGRGWLTRATVGVARGDTFPDALGGGAAMGSVGGPVLLTKPTSLTPAASSCISDWRSAIKRITVFGSPSAVSSAVFAQLAQ